MGNLTCKAADCDWPASIRGRCNAHHAQWRRGMPEGPIRRRVDVNRRCAIDGCGNGALRGPLCSMHFHRKTKQGDPGGPGKQRPGGSRVKAREGYIRVHMPQHSQANCDGYVQEHRLVMERVLGRPLQSFENVHHKNGQRADNRPENLELWTKPQPTGQRPEDLIAWMVHYYPELVDAELKARKREQRTGQLRLVV